MDLERDGYCWDEIPVDQLSEITKECDRMLKGSSKGFGIRGVVRQSADLAKFIEKALVPIAQKYLGANAFLVRSILFDKPLDANWAVPWHQDVTIEVLEKHEVEGFGPWSIKDGVVSVQPPASVLESMITLRLHLDDTDASNGALLVEPGSHMNGKKHIQDILTTVPVVLDCKVGHVLVMRPLLYHASNRSTSGKPRRILHLDFAANQLPASLVWLTN